MRTSIFASGAVAIAAALAFAGPGQAAEGDAQLSVLHGVPGLTVDVWVHGERALAAGTRVTVERHGAPALIYRVRSVELMAKDKFDGGSLFRRDGPHQLKPVTCGGRWLDGKQDCSDNVIVTAELE